MRVWSHTRASAYEERVQSNVHKDPTPAINPAACTYIWLDFIRLRVNRSLAAHSGVLRLNSLVVSKQANRLRDHNPSSHSPRHNRHSANNNHTASTPGSCSATAVTTTSPPLPLITTPCCPGCGSVVTPIVDAPPRPSMMRLPSPLSLRLLLGG